MRSSKLVEFSDLALAAIRRITSDESKQESLKASLRFYLRRDAEERSYPCLAFDDLPWYVYMFSDWRVLFENGDRIVIWSIRPKFGS